MNASNPILLTLVLTPILRARFLLPLLLLAASEGLDPTPHTGEVRLTIARDPYSSSDQVTLCRVRAINDGSRPWQGRSLRFEARAVDVNPPIRQRGRFGLELAPHGSLETLISLPGRHDRFEVELLTAGKDNGGAKSPRARAANRKNKKTSGASRKPH
jgi:hypothetical protein